jgi:hypothetical protein
MGAALAGVSLAFESAGERRAAAARGALTPRQRAIAGLRIDHFGYDVTSSIPINSGTGTQDIVSPKVALAWRAAQGVELYANYGSGFHSNDARGVTARVDPLDPSVPVNGAPGLSRQRGAEGGENLNAWLRATGDHPEAIQIVQDIAEVRQLSFKFVEVGHPARLDAETFAPHPEHLLVGRAKPFIGAWREFFQSGLDGLGRVDLLETGDRKWRSARCRRQRVVHRHPPE